VEVPILDQGDFTSLTVTGQLEAVSNAVSGKPAVLMGSSLGGYIAALFASRHALVEKLILMAPAFRFPSRWRERYPAPEMHRWKRNGTYPIFHYGYGREVPLAYRFVEDSQSLRRRAGVQTACVGSARPRGSNCTSRCFRELRRTPQERGTAAV
jgi:pimeloyl-ACP methyl ester carboxylesterase